MSEITRRGFMSLASSTIVSAVLAACSQGGRATATDEAPSADQPTPDEPAPEEPAEPEGKRPEEDASGFVLLADVAPDVIQEIRYYTTFNFVGERIDGYEQPVALLTREAAEALRRVSDSLVAQGYRLKIFDAYRPQKAVDHFVRWAQDDNDTRMKRYFYPDIDKSLLFPYGYIAERSGHTRGSTVDLTLFSMEAEREVDMGGTYDFFGLQSSLDYTTLTEQQYAHRMLLREAMTKEGFAPLGLEWWHFALSDEPYPDTYFTFPSSIASIS